MSDKKFSQFTIKTTLTGGEKFVGYATSDNIQADINVLLNYIGANISSFLMIYAVESDWITSDPTLPEGFFMISSDSLATAPKFKISDGVNSWTALPYTGGASLAQVLAIDNKTNGVPIKSNDSNTFLTIINGGATFQSDGNINHNAAQHIFLGNFSAMDSGGNTGFGFNASSFSIYTGVNKYYTLTSAAATFRHTVKNTFNAPVHEFNNSVTKGGLELATENFVNNAIAGLKFKVDVVAASIANVNISSAPSSIDGVTLTSGDRVLLKNQTSATENGCYIFNGTGSAMTRATDSDSGSELVSATYPVIGGATNQDTWFTITNDSITIGSTNIVISQTAGSGTYTVGSYLKLIGNVFDIDFTTFSTTQISEGTNKYLSNSNLATVDHAATVKTTIVDADEVNGLDSANSFSLFKTTWANIMVYIKSKLFAKVNGGNTNYSIADADKIIYIGTAFTAPRTYTLPTAASVNGSKTIADFIGTITSVNTLTIGVQTGEYLNGVLNGTEVIQSAYGQRVLYPDGVNNWSFDAGIVRQTKSQTISNKTLDSTNIAVTQSAGDNSTKIATTEYIDRKTLFKTTSDSSTHTGTLTNTIVFSEDISNKLSSGDIAEIVSDVVRVSGSTSATIRYYLNSSNSLSGATQIGQYIYGFSGLNIVDFRRQLIVKSSTSIRIKGALSSSPNDYSIFSNYTDVTVNLGSLWLIFAITLGNTGDQFLVSSRKMIK